MKEVVGTFATRMDSSANTVISTDLVCLRNNKKIPEQLQALSLSIKVNIFFGDLGANFSQMLNTTNAAVNKSYMFLCDFITQGDSDF